jgi:hypothetical protein
MLRSSFASRHVQLSAMGLGRVETAPSSPMRDADAELGTELASWHVSGGLGAPGEPAPPGEGESAPDQAWIAFISGPMPMMFITRVRL